MPAQGRAGIKQGHTHGDGVTPRPLPLLVVMQQRGLCCVAEVQEGGEEGLSGRRLPLQLPCSLLDLVLNILYSM